MGQSQHCGGPDDFGTTNNSRSPERRNDCRTAILAPDLPKRLQTTISRFCIVCIGEAKASYQNEPENITYPFSTCCPSNSEDNTIAVELCRAPILKGVLYNKMLSCLIQAWIRFNVQTARTSAVCEKYRAHLRQILLHLITIAGSFIAATESAY